MPDHQREDLLIRATKGIMQLGFSHGKVFLKDRAQAAATYVEEHSHADAMAFALDDVTATCIVITKFYLRCASSVALKESIWHNSCAWTQTLKHTMAAAFLDPNLEAAHY